MLITVLGVMGCRPNEHTAPMQSTTETKSMVLPSATEWQQFNRLRIAFGHQSVGFNLLEGIATLAKQENIAIAVEESTAPFNAPGIHHFRIGHNEDPASKLVAFNAAMQGDFAASSDVAMMKFCYIDFGDQTNPQQLAKDYIDELNALSRANHNTHFVPMTAPLTTVQTGPKAWLKRMTGKSPAGYAENARRQLFNNELRQHYAGANILFDIAALESHQRSVTITANNAVIEVLDPTLTSDGGHLNAAGERLLGAALVRHLARFTPQP